MGDTSIEWTDRTWNPVRGCSRVSPGCVNCYAEGVAARFSGPGLAYEGLAVRRLKVISDDDQRVVSRWTGEVRMVPEHLADPLRWTKPRRIFVNSMSDLFHEKLSNEEIAAVFGVMAAAPRHTFQVLTKRAERMREWFAWSDGRKGWGTDGTQAALCWRDAVARLDGAGRAQPFAPGWPLPNVWLGVSVEDQQRADERIPLLLQTPAAVRFVSYEPALGTVNFEQYLFAEHVLTAEDDGRYTHRKSVSLDWVIVGGESGNGARPFDVAWARSVVQQCNAAGVPVFVKQMGARPFYVQDPPRRGVDVTPLKFDNKKGGDMSEWPEDLRVREFPGDPAAPSLPVAPRRRA